MEHLFQLVPKGKILEVGVGHGGDAKLLMDQYGEPNYIGCEPSEGLLQVAKSNLGYGDIRPLTIYDLNFPFQFDAFWICATLIHIPKNKLQFALNKVHNCIKSGGIGFVSVMEGNSDMQQSRPGRYYSLWSQSEFEKEITTSNFEIISTRKVPTSESPWLAYLLRAI
jgi:ubiquinone/menaquinone biosynthesis C-methylase UbiE